MKASNETTFRQSVEMFIFNWHSFPIDYWWRRKYNVAFGSPAHRAMNFIDMAIEWIEELKIDEYNHKQDEYVDEEFGLRDDNAVKLSPAEIDEDFDNLNIDEY